MNYLLLSNKKRKNNALHLIGKSILNGSFIYEILLDRIDKTETLVKQLKCRVKNIIVNPEYCDMHISILQMKNTIDISSAFTTLR